MAKRKTTKKSTQTSLFSFSAETIDSIIGVILVALSLLVFFATQETAAHGDTPLLGKYLSQIGIILFGEYYRILFAPILFGL